MDSKDRGVIRFRDRARQINNFSNMRYCRGITPTDIDGAFEFDGEMFIFFELKYKDKGLDTGQELFLRRLCNIIIDSGKHCLCIHGKHFIEDSNMDVNADECVVVKYYADSKKWIQPNKEITLHELVDLYIQKYGKLEWIV